MVKQVQVPMDDRYYWLLVTAKGQRTWLEFMLDYARILLPDYEEFIQDRSREDGGDR